MRVPMREITLSGGEAPLRVYDTSGPQGRDVRKGLPPLRRRLDRRPRRRRRPAGSGRVRVGGGLPGAGCRPRRATAGVTQLHHARRGAVTEEMEFVALREGFAPEFVRDEVARGRAIIPANINHPSSSRWPSAATSW